MELKKTGYVYKLVSKDVNVKECYIGSTMNTRIRKARHKAVCNNIKYKQYNYRVYQFIRDNGGFQNWEMIELERFEYERTPQLRAKERHHMELLGAVLNCNVPNRNKAEWRRDNPEYHKEHYRKNAELINEKHDCLCGGKYTTQNKTCHEKTIKHNLHMLRIIAQE
jgi:hypothetical protein